MFAYDVMTEQEAIEERYSLLKEGIYDAIILTSEDRISTNSGNPMMDMTVQVFDEQGRYHNVRDFLVFTKPMMWKVIHFSKSAGILQEYESGKLCSEVATAKRVKVKIGIEEGKEIPLDKLKNAPAGSRYPSRNKIEDYICENIKNKGKDEIKLEDDDIEF